MRLFASLTIILMLIYSSRCLECSAESFTNIPQNTTDEQISSCFREILREGATEVITNISNHLSQKHEKQLIMALEEEMQRLRQLQGELILGESTLEPVLKWGQNISHVFINIKTSHRWDSPPCLNTKSQTAFLNETFFEYVNVCVVSQQKLTFLLRLNLYKLVSISGQRGQLGNQLDFKVNKNGVGMSSAVFQKLEYEIWPYLNKEETNFAIWPQIAQIYSSDHKKYEEMNRKLAKQKRAKATKGEYGLFLCLSTLLLLCFI